MNQMIQSKTLTRSVLILVALFSTWLAPETQGVNPPPDGGYPAFNTAEGQNALFHLSAGVGNTAVGWFSLSSNTDGSYNTAVGAGALLFNVGDPNTGHGVENTAIGAGALLSNTTGFRNTANGALALLNNTIGFANTAMGHQAMTANIGGDFNTAYGDGALESHQAEDHNTAVGASALHDDINGVSNTAVGSGALANNTTGDANTAIGYLAGSNQTIGNNNVYIGANITGIAGESNACYIKSIFSQVSPLGAPVLINGSNKLGTAPSSKHYKQDIKATGNASESLFALRPVTFRYKTEFDPAGIPQFGLVAEEVENVNPDLVVRDTEGKPFSVRYDQVNAMLLNEFLKEHRKVQEQQATIAQLQKDMEKVLARLQEHDSKIQQVSDQIELSGSASRVVSD